MSVYHKSLIPVTVVVLGLCILGNVLLSVSLSRRSSLNRIGVNDREILTIIQDLREAGLINKDKSNNTLTLDKLLDLYDASEATDVINKDKPKTAENGTVIDNANKVEDSRHDGSVIKDEPVVDLTQNKSRSEPNQAHSDKANSSVTNEMNTAKSQTEVVDEDEHIYLVENPKLAKVRRPDKHKRPSAVKKDPTAATKITDSETDIDTESHRMAVYRKYYRPIEAGAGIDCMRIVNADQRSIDDAKTKCSKEPRKAIPAAKYAVTKDCDNFKRGRGYIEDPLSSSERDFPLAFAIVVYKNVEQAERLLRAIYRPQNYYCIHVDMKASQLDVEAWTAISRCFDNVFLTPDRVNVTWGQFSVLEAELSCQRVLWRYPKWKYYINLTGQEFPLKTNREIVAILNAMKGANVVDGTWERARKKYFYRWGVAGRAPPHNIRPIKGSVHVAINRAFVDFILHDNRARDFLEWLKKTQIPDETLYSSLNHNPHLGIPGSFLGEPEEYPLKPSFMRYKNWDIGHNTWVRQCGGKYVRNICVLGIADIHKAIRDVGLFANKFFLDFEHIGFDCLEEILHKRTWEQYVHNSEIHVTFYEQLDQVKYQVRAPG